MALLYVSGDVLTRHQEYTLYMATGKPAHLGYKFLLDVSVVNSPIVVELLVITVLFCVALLQEARRRTTKQRLPTTPQQ